MNIAKTVHDHIVAEFAPDVTEIPADYDLVEGAVVDSLGLVRLIAWIGQRFSLRMDELDLDPATFRTIRGIADFIAQHTTTVTTTAS